MENYRANLLLCAGTGCVASGTPKVTAALREELEKRGLSDEIKIVLTGCNGFCAEGPVMLVYPEEIFYQKLTVEEIPKLVEEHFLKGRPYEKLMFKEPEKRVAIPVMNEIPFFKHQVLRVLRNKGLIDPESLDEYIARDGYMAAAKALHEMTPEDIIALIKDAGIRGRGGAGFPTGLKWEFASKSQADQKYMLCNGDEGDPGAFMDRAILESDPHSVIEGMIIAGYAIGARYGYIYVRAEYPLAVKRVRTALRQARKSKLLGRHILGSEFSFNIRLFQGSGAFVCGEETALIASLEGKSGTPHHRPPYPATSGLYGKPTLLNNIKTFAYIRHIINNGAQWFTKIGTKGSTGTAVFALAGKIVNTGLVEVPMGTTLRQVIFDVGSGIPEGKLFKAVQIGGPSGGCLPESTLDLPIEFDSLQNAGAMMGSGGMVVLDEDDCMVEIARYFLEFTQRESCGKCTFCRLGTKQMLETLANITKGQGSIEDIDTLNQLAEDVRAGSLCGLGKTAPNPILTTLRYFRDEYEAHIKEGRCPALMCTELIAYYIIPEKCERSCDACVGTCTVEAISPNKKRIKVIDQEKCVKCGTCLTACPPQYNAVVKLSPPSEVPASK